MAEPPLTAKHSNVKLSCGSGLIDFQVMFKVSGKHLKSKECASLCSGHGGENRLLVPRYGPRFRPGSCDIFRDASTCDACEEEAEKEFAAIWCHCCEVKAKRRRGAAARRSSQPLPKNSRSAKVCQNAFHVQRPFALAFLIASEHVSTQLESVSVESWAKICRSLEIVELKDLLKR